MTGPHLPMASAPSPDEDPTGVRALLSALPEPGPMPAHVVARINASLAAAQTERSATSAGGSVTPLVPGRQRRPGRVLFAAAGAAAAVVLVAVVGGSLFRTIATSDSSTTAAGPITSSSREAEGGASAGAPDKSAVGSPSAPTLIQIRRSQTRYTRADFASQARTLSGTTFGPSQLRAADSQGGLAAGTAAGLTECLAAAGVDGGQIVRADIAFYDGAPAVVIVATRNGIQTAYALGLECSRADAAVLHPATSLP